MYTDKGDDGFMDRITGTMPDSDHRSSLVRSRANSAYRKPLSSPGACFYDPGAGGGT